MDTREEPRRVPIMKELRWTFKAVISIGLLTYLVSMVPLADVMSAIAEANVLQVATAIVLGTMARYAEASRMRLLTQSRGIRLSTWDIQRLNLTTNFYDMLLPGLFAGGVLRWRRFSTAGGNAAGALEALIVNRLSQTIVLAGFGLVFWVLDERARVHALAGIGIATFLAALLLVHFSIANRAVTQKWILRIVRVSVVHGFLQDAFTRLAKSTGQNGKVPTRPAIRLWGFTLLAEALALLSFYLLAQSLRIDLSLVSIGWVRCAIVLATMLPLSISGVGIRDATLVYLLTPYGVAPAAAMGLSFLLLARRTLTGLLGGIIAMRESAPWPRTGPRSTSHDRTLARSAVEMRSLRPGNRTE